MQKPLAAWSPAQDAWVTDQSGLFCEHLDVYSETLPKQGTTLNGILYELPTSVPPTEGFVSSSSLGHESKESLLSTPQSRDYKGLPADGYNLKNLVRDLALLPTPKAGDADFGLPRTSGRPPEKSTHLATRLHYTDFEDYTPAIDRWTPIIGRPAPSHTLPTGKSGKYEHSAAFVEWMMGLPQGWVTDTDTTRNEQLKALGNGVVPQQAAEAIKRALEKQ